jgi:hypothetical protein
MARMVPRQPSTETKSDAEKRVFGRLRDEVTDEWVILHSLGLATHRRKPWAEIDFVAIGPPGVICLEIKGGEVRREAGQWVFVDRHGNRNQKHEGPFEQVGSASAALYQWLKDRSPWASRVIVGYGVVIPDAPFTVDGPDILTEVLYDARDTDMGLGDYLEAVADYWRQRLDSRRPTEPVVLDPRRIGELVELLRRDFDLVPTAAVAVRAVNRELVRLTEQQRGVLRGLEENSRLWVRGGAGTGKTLLATDEARRLAAEGKTVLYLCFNKRLARLQAEALQDFANVRCVHLHGLMAQLVHSGGGRPQRPDVDDDYYFTTWLPERALEVALSEELVFDALVIDEGQDLLLPGYIDFLDAVLVGGLKKGCWRWFSDPAQNIFRASSPEAAEELLGCSPAQYRLTLNCRNTAAIATTAHLISGVAWTEVTQVDGPEVEMLWYRDSGEARKVISRYVARLISGGVKPGSIVVLGRRHLDGGVLSAGLEDLLPYPLVEAPSPRRAIEFATIQSFKGLESEAVILIDLDGFELPDLLADFYAAATRPRSHLALAIDERFRSQYSEMARRFGETLSGNEI